MSPMCSEREKSAAARTAGSIDTALPGDKDVISQVDRLRPYVLGVKVAHPRDKLKSGVASEWPKPSPIALARVNHESA